MKKKLSLVVGLVVLSLALGGCAGKTLSSDEVYFTALVWYNDNLEQFKFYYDMADPQTQADWNENIRPKFMAMSVVLDGWKTALDTGQGYDEKVRMYRDLKNELLRLLIAVFPKKEA